MAYTVLIDACVLYSFSTRDLLLRLAERGLFQPAWSAEILDEMARNLEARGIPADRLRSMFMEVFEEACISGGSRLLARVPDGISPKDRHVVATAFAAHADVLVTFNIRDFPLDALAPSGLEVQTPDEFLLEQLTLNPARVLQALREQAAQHRKPPMSLEALALHAPEFAKRAGTLLATGP